jgi:hypothetical protein
LTSGAECAPSRVDGKTLERVRRMRDEGRSIREVAVALKVPRSTVARALAARAEAKSP